MQRHPQNLASFLKERQLGLPDSQPQRRKGGTKQLLTGYPEWVKGINRHRPYLFIDARNFKQAAYALSLRGVGIISSTHHRQRLPGRHLPRGSGIAILSWIIHSLKLS